MTKPRIPNQRKANIEHKRRTERYAQLIQMVYDRVAQEAARLASLAGADPTKPFSFADYPLTKEAVKRLQSQFIGDVQAVIMAGTSEEWRESNLVQDLVARKVLTAYVGTDRNGEEHTRYFQINPDSLKAFQQRREGGMNLSDRVWNLSEQYRMELEDAISAAIAPGISAQQLSLDVRKFLNEPDLMFRRFRYKDENGRWKRKWKKRYTDEEGNVRFKDCDRDSYKNQWTGPGYYKSSAKNAMRLARTEINMAYRTAEQTRWQQFDFVVGYEVKTTQNGHHVEDICDQLAGKYPKDFKFRGWHPQCYDELSEVLTNEGWKRFKDVKATDRILSLNPDSREMEWVGIADRQCYDHSGDMIHFYNRSLDCLVTPEHRMVYLNKSDGEIRYCQAEDYTKGKGAFYRGAKYDGIERDFFEIEGRKVTFDDFCEFMGYYLSDGSIQHGTGVCISQQEGEPAYESILEVCRRMGYNPKVSQPNICIYNSAINRYLSQFGRCTDKYIPEEIKTASKRQIRIFLDAFLKCDGSVRPSRSFVGSHCNVFRSDKSERTYYTTSERMAGDLTELILKVGNRPSFYIQQPQTTQKKDGSLIIGNHICYRISECYSTTATVFNKDVVQYSGKVYDLTLERNHIMYIRRNGKCFWGSNCMCYCIPILKTDDEFWAYDPENPGKSANEITELPSNFREWMDDNKERIEAAEKRGKLPYFIRDNREVVEEILNPKPKRTPLEIAEERHAARSQEEIERIQYSEESRSPHYGAAMKLGRSATKEAMKVVENIGAPELSEVQKRNIRELADALGISRKEIKPMSFLDADQGASNPTKDDSNCQSCVVAFSARRRGIDCFAQAYDERGPSKEAFHLGERFQDAWLNPKTGKPLQPTVLRGHDDNEIIAKLKRTLSQPGEYVLGTNDKKGKGHVVNVINSNGKIIIHDEQAKRESDRYRDLESLIDIDYLEVIKIDKAILNTNLIKHILIR